MFRALTYFWLIGFGSVTLGLLARPQFEPGPPGQINALLTWADNSDNEKAYVIQRANSPKGPWSRAGRTDANETAFLDRKLKAGTVYYYRVYAVGDDDYSPYSNIATVTTASRATAPRMKKQPLNLSAVVGSDTAFVAEAIGNPPMTYQWRFNGTNIDGETGTNLTVHFVQPENAGTYSMVVSNANGYTISYAARLTVTAPLIVNVKGGGSVLPNYNGVNLEVGRRYSVRAYPAAGNVFQSWAGVTNPPAGVVLSFVMQTNLILEASFVDVARPTVTATAPSRNARQTNSVATLKGIARDNREVAAVYYQVNGGQWSIAAGTTNWLGQINLAAGQNTWRVYAVDATGNCSLTNSQVVTYVVNLPLIVQTNGSGVVSPNYNNRPLEIGVTYSMSARAVAGFVFTNWIVSDSFTTTNSTRPTLSFLMRSNLIVQANFRDVQRPTLTISNSALTAGKMAGATVVARGAASDNGKIAGVYYQLNGGLWSLAEGAIAWFAPIKLAAGTNQFRAYCVDTDGNKSVTNTVTAVARALPQPTISDINVTPEGVLISFNSVGNVTYSLEAKDTLDAAEWTPLPTTTSGTGELLQLIDTNPPSESRFYRVRATSP